MWTVANEFERYPDGSYSYSAGDVEWVKAVAARIRRMDTVASYRGASIGVDYHG